ncbi:hypothetical protein [Bacillus safensis]|uniref:hypothetical protein n=1 Tax=Bacillus safensis TaxID=561879 RepID=UPI0020CF9160|nr:hypothetical protein [Bacillus safensis]MCP9283006.1 hypothetical protein [Bacillus safensis]
MCRLDRNTTENSTEDTSYRLSYNSNNRRAGKTAFSLAHNTNASGVDRIDRVDFIERYLGVQLLEWQKDYIRKKKGGKQNDRHSGCM